MKRKSGSIVIRTENIIRLNKLIPKYSKTDSKGNIVVSPEYDDIINILLDSFEKTKIKPKKMYNIHEEDKEAINDIIDNNGKHIAENAANIVYEHIILLLQEDNIIPYKRTYSDEENTIVDYAMDKYYESR